MIRNMNQLTFQGFGTVPPERSQDRAAGATWDLKGQDAQVWRAAAETWVSCSGGMCVLSVSLDGEAFQHYYLDKTARIRTGVYFALRAFLGEASAVVSSAAQPLPSDKVAGGSLSLEHRLRVERIFTLFYQEKEQGFLFPGESHPMAELTYVDRGELHSVADGQDLLLKQGDLVIYGPDQWHMQYADIGVAPRFVTISFDAGTMALLPLLNRKFQAPQRAVGILQSILREEERMDAYSKDIILSELNLLLLLLLRSCDDPKTGKLQTVNSIHSENEIIRQAQQYVSTHIREKLSVPLVARQVDVSPSYLTALFHKNLQISPGEYIRRIKLQESKQMIRENDLTFTEIAAQLQYSTVHHFSRQFKEKFGITPTEYAKSVR